MAENMIYRKKHLGETGLSEECVFYNSERLSTYCMKLSKYVEKSDSELVRQTLSKAGWFESNDLLCKQVRDGDTLINAMTLAEEFGIYLYNAKTKKVDFARLAGVMPKEDGTTDIPELLASMEKSAKHAEDMYSLIYTKAKIPDVLEGLGFAEDGLQEQT